MKIQYVEPSGHDGITPVTVTVSSEWVRQMYFPHWKERGRKHPSWDPTATEEELFAKCLSDFIVVNWAQII